MLTFKVYTSLWHLFVAEGAANFERERAACTHALNEERARYVHEAKVKLASLSKSTKAWWRFNCPSHRRHPQAGKDRMPSQHCVMHGNFPSLVLTLLGGNLPKKK